MSKYYEIPKVEIEHVNFVELIYFDGIKHLYQFDNGYGASVIYHEFSYGLELSVIKFNDDGGYQICYDTPITDDVIGYIKGKEQLEELLNKIKEL